jgi:streptogramin lyase
MRTPSLPLWIAAGALCAASLALAACNARSASAPPAPTRTPAAIATATVAPTPTLPPARYTRIVLAHGFGSPDDLALDAQGRIIFADFGNNGVNRLNTDGSITVLARGFPEPEGIVPLPDGSLIVAVQGNNGDHIDMIEHLTPPGYAATVIRTFSNNTNLPGIDSLSLDPATGDLLVADSPNGIIYRMRPDGSNLHRIAAGFVRPTEALAGPDGAVYVADEYGGVVARIAPDGTVTHLAQLSYPDDLAWDADGSLLVTALGDNTVVRLDPVTGTKLATLAGDLFEPQGLAVDARGDVFVSEQRANIIIELRRG